MNVLAFDTCLASISVAYRYRGADGGWLRVDAAEARQTGHAERLMPMIGEVLDKAGATFASVQRLAVTLGPGSFTGVRTGIAAARGFRLAAGVEIVGMTSLAVIAQRAFIAQPAFAAHARHPAQPVLVAVDARRGRLYVQHFQSSALMPSGGPVEVTAEEALAMAGGRATLLAGSGAAMVLEAASATERARLTEMASIITPCAGDLAELAPSLLPSGDVCPVYIRPPDAKPQTGKSLARAP